MSKTKHYQHFCPVARSLEVIGEKWSLLIVRDLLGGEARFTDLMRGLSNITPKWLTLRLRELEEVGIVERVHQEGKREVWYRLTPKGRELGNVIGELNTWGLRFAMRPPHEDEPVGDRQFGRSFAGYLRRCDVRLSAPRTWSIEFAPGNVGWYAFDGVAWNRATAERPDVTVRTSPREWAAVIGEGAGARRERLAGMDISGGADAIAEFVDVMCAMVEPVAV